MSAGPVEKGKVLHQWGKATTKWGRSVELKDTITLGDAGEGLEFGHLLVYWLEEPNLGLKNKREETALVKQIVKIVQLCLV